MSKKSTRLFLILLALLLLVLIVWRLAFPKSLDQIPGAAPSTTSPLASSVASPSTTSTPQEQPIVPIPLAGPASESRSEISGMAWYHDTLILLPQYPSRFGSGDGAVFGLAKDDILAYLDGSSSQPLSPVEIPFIAPKLKDIDGFEGFEAIAFSGDQVYLTIETKPDQMLGYLVVGIMAPDLSEMRLDLTTLAEISPGAQIDNMTDEALLVTPGGVLSFFEANGLKNNPSPLAHLFSLNGHPLGTLPMINLEYRLTDVTSLDSTDRFWGINYFFPGDTKLTPDTDPLAIKYGEGATHTVSTAVERLVQFQYSSDGIILTDTPPIQLQLLADNGARNWEALAYLDQQGFLLATDKFPETILAFVGYP